MKSVAKSFIDAVVSNREEHELKRLWYSGELFSQPRCCDLKLWSRVKKPFPSFSFTALNSVIRLRLCDPAHIDPRPMSHFRA